MFKDKDKVEYWLIVVAVLLAVAALVLTVFILSPDGKEAQEDEQVNQQEESQEKDLAQKEQEKGVEEGLEQENNKNEETEPQEEGDKGQDQEKREDDKDEDKKDDEEDKNEDKNQDDQKDQEGDDQGGEEGEEEEEDEEDEEDEPTVEELIANDDIGNCRTNFKSVYLYVYFPEKFDPDKLEDLREDKALHQKWFNKAGRGKITMDMSYPVVPIEIPEDEEEDYIGRKSYVTRYEGTEHEVEIIQIKNMDSSRLVKEFYKDHPDKFDFINMFTNFRFGDTDTPTHTDIRNNVSNIGREPSSKEFYSNYDSEKLLGFNYIGYYKEPPHKYQLSKERRTCRTANTLIHETAHQWAASVGDVHGSGGDLVLRGDVWHWDAGLNLNYDAIGGLRWQDNGDKIFTVLPPQEYCAPQDPDNPREYGLERFSDLTLYLAGAIKASQVEPILWIDYDHSEVGFVGETAKPTTVKHITIEDIVERHGLRKCK